MIESNDIIIIDNIRIRLKDIVSYSESTEEGHYGTFLCIAISLVNGTHLKLTTKTNPTDIVKKLDEYFNIVRKIT